MDSHFWLEMVGYLGSVIVAISLMMRSLLRLRVINTLGCLAFVAYGLLIHAYPVAILNGFVACINLFFLIRMFRQKDYFQLLEVAHDSAYLGSLLDFYKKDIQAIFPDYVHDPRSDNSTWLVLRNAVPAGVLVVQREAAQAKVLLDYAIPTYRDFGVARFLYRDKAEYFHQQGIQRFVSAPGAPHHSKYLERMGFRRQDATYVYDVPGGALKDAGI